LGADDVAVRNTGGETLGSREVGAMSGAVDGPNGPDDGPITQANDQEEEGLGRHPCVRCGARLETSDALQSHQDWHFAKDLQDEERGTMAFGNQPSTAAASPHSGGRKAGPAAPKRPGRPRKTERGQQKLTFG
jgi:DNA polymerase eta